MRSFAWFEDDFLTGSSTAHAFELEGLFQNDLRRDLVDDLRPARARAWMRATITMSNIAASGPTDRSIGSRRARGWSAI